MRTVATVCAALPISVLLLSCGGGAKDSTLPAEKKPAKQPAAVAKAPVPKPREVKASCEGYGDLRWGVSLAKAQEQLPHSRVHRDSLVVEGGIYAGFAVTATYLRFENDKLSMVTITMAQPSAEEAKAVYHKIKSELVVSYGKSGPLQLGPSQLRYEMFCHDSSNVTIALRRDPWFVLVNFEPRSEDETRIYTDGELNPQLRTEQSAFLENLKAMGVVLRFEGTTYTLSPAHWAASKGVDLVRRLQMHSIAFNGTQYIRVVDDKGVVLAEVTEERGLVVK